jgi:hypothetical protein
VAVAVGLHALARVVELGFAQLVAQIERLTEKLELLPVPIVEPGMLPL